MVTSKMNINWDKKNKEEYSFDFLLALTCSFFFTMRLFGMLYYTIWNDRWKRGNDVILLLANVTFMIRSMYKGQLVSLQVFGFVLPLKNRAFMEEEKPCSSRACVLNQTFFIDKEVGLHFYPYISLL